MRTFCALLFVGIIANAYAETHDCDPFAANISKDPSRSGHDADNQVIPIADFLKATKTYNFVARATPVNVADDFCVASSFDEGCAAIHYYREILSAYKPKKDGELLGIRFRTVFVGTNLDSGNSILYDMEIEAIDHNDYIFKHVEGTEIKAWDVDADGTKEPVTLPSHVQASLKKEFAVHYSTPDFSVSVTCDGQSIWAAYNKNVVANNEEGAFAKQMEDIIEKLKNHPKMNNKKPQVKPAATVVPKYIVPLVTGA